MNERMLELAEEAGFIVEADNVFADSFEKINASLDVYTDLIVQECLDAVNRIKNDPLTNMGVTQKMRGSTITAKDWMVAVVEDVELEIKKQFRVE